MAAAAGTDGAGFADTLLQNLPVGGFAVAEDRADVFWLVTLADTGIDANLLEQVGHAKGARLIGDDRHNTRAQGLVLEQVGEHAHEGHGGGHFLARRQRGETGVCHHRGTFTGAARWLRLGT